MSQLHVKVLENAREQLLNSSDYFLCICINCHANKKMKKQVLEITNQIQRDISHGATWSRTLEGWLNMRGINHEYHMEENVKAREKLKATHLAWIDALIIYWRNKL